MRKYIFTAIIFILILTVSQGISAQTISPNLADNNNYFEGFNALRLDRSSLFLPSDNSMIQKSKSFSLKGQEKLFNLASQFDRKDNDQGLSFGNDLINEKINLDRLVTYNGDDLEIISYSPDEKMNIKTNYKEEIKNLESLIQTSFDLNYKLNSRTTVRAGYDLVGKKRKDSNELLPDDLEKEDESSKEKKEENYISDTNEQLQEDEDEANLSENDTKEETNNQMNSNDILDQQGRVGISYKTTDRISLSADYVKNNIFRETNGDSTIFGVEYVDEEGKLRARYEIVDGETRQETITGLELDLKNLASFSASYTLLNPQQIRDKLNKESVWDFGVDFNLSDETSFSIDYQLKDKSEAVSGENFFDQKESNINASFKINF